MSRIVGPSNGRSLPTEGVSSAMEKASTDSRQIKEPLCPDGHVDRRELTVMEPETALALFSPTCVGSSAQYTDSTNEQKG